MSGPLVPSLVSQPEVVPASSGLPTSLTSPSSVHTGVRTTQWTGTCIIFGSSGFLWLLCLRPTEWSKVYLLASIPAWCRAPIHKRWASRLTTGPLWSSATPSVAFGCGPVSDATSSLQALPFTGPRLLALTDWPRRVDRFTRSVTSQFVANVSTLAHSVVGGVTQHKLLWVSLGLPSLVVPPTVPLTVGAILEHRHWLRPCDNPVGLLTSTDRLNTRCLDVSVYLPSAFSPTGFGSRRLVAKELCLAWDLPLWCHTDPPPALRSLVPLKSLLALADTTVPFVSQAGPGLGCVSLPVQVPVLPDDRTWLPLLGRWLPHSWVDDSLITDKGAKADGADIPSHLWDLRIRTLFDSPSSSLAVLRRWLFRVACRRLFKSFIASLDPALWWQWCHCPHHPKDVCLGGGIAVSLSVIQEFRRNLSCGRQAICHYVNASWWKWDKGSSLLFWRWPTLQGSKAARDGFPWYLRESRPSHKGKQRGMLPNVRDQVAEKLRDVSLKGYVQPLTTRVLSDVHSFPVAKVKDPLTEEWLDIRMVFDATKSGLNECTWVPNFWLPSPKTALRQLHPHSYMVDCDIGEMFLNFPIPISVRPFAGSRMDQIASQINKEPCQHPGCSLPASLCPANPQRKVLPEGEAWTRCLFGARPSPFMAIRHFLLAEEFIIGNPREKGSPMRWDEVILNLPGSPGFDPRLPWVYKWDRERQCIAGITVTFVDDGRGSGSSLEHAWQVAQRFAKRAQFLGIQHATRKLRPPSQSPGAWCGMICKTNGNEIMMTVSQAKWDKAKSIIHRIQQELETSPTLNHKQLERDRGFLIHLASTFTAINPYLKGIHLTLDSWRDNRKADGWKMSSSQWLAYLESVSDENKRASLADLGSKYAPKNVKPVPRLSTDIAALARFFQRSTPTEICARNNQVCLVCYGFGDASGNGFGDTFVGKDGISFCHGVWCERISSKSSNYREFRNCVDALARQGKNGALKGAFVLFCTDNSTVEHAIHKGSCDSPELLQLVIEFQALQMDYGCTVVVSHVAGTRMIAQGTDGLSRGALNEGVMGGTPITDFLPFHLSAVERSPHLLDWIQTWGGAEAELLSPNDWFVKGHDLVGSLDSNPWRPTIRAGTYIWAPPPAACDVALEELRKARHKRQNSIHILVCPRLMTPLWLRQLYRACDMVFEIPPCCPFWESHLHEPCLVGICFPFLHCYPWSLRNSNIINATGGKLRRMWEDEYLHTGSVLCKLFTLCRRLRSMQSKLVRQVLQINQ